MVTDLLTVREAAARLRISLRSAWSWISSGRLRALHLGERTVRIETAELDRLLADARSRAGRLGNGR